MEIDLIIKNYRCFQKPARIVLRKGFSAFVGINNSGKSSLLKFFYEFRWLFNALSEPSELQSAFQGNGRAGPGAQGQPKGADPQEVFNDSNQRDIELEFRFAKMKATAPANAIPTRLSINYSRQALGWTAKLYFSDDSPLIANEQLLRFNVPGEPATQSLGFEGDYVLLYKGNTRISFAPIIPVFRFFANTLYIGPFRNIINVGTREDYFDVEVGQGFIQTWKRHKTGNVKQRSEAILRLTDDIGRIFGYDRLEINPSDDNETLQLVINNKPYKLAEVGAGIAQFVLVLANAAIRRPAFILIDEPELNLHPSLQLDFLTTLTSYASGGIMYATHSIGLAQSNAERIYSVRRVAEGDSEVTDYDRTPRLAEFIGELGFSGYKELGFDKLLLVEGRTEVKAIQQFLRLWHKDHEVLLIPLGGDAVINARSTQELEELTRITTNIFALIDSEVSVAGDPLPPNRQAFRDIRDKLKIRCHILKYRATENYFTERAVKRALGDKYRRLGPYEKLESATRSWSKSENWRIAREMTQDDLALSDLGQFLQELCQT
jgi:hypothetical protein